VVGGGLPARARHVQIRAQRAPHLARIDAGFDRLCTGTATQFGQHVVGEQRIASGGAEFVVQQFVEIGQTHSANVAAAIGQDRPTMGQLIYSMMTSLDGFTETVDRSLGWVHIDEEVHNFANDEFRSTGTSLYGRRIYELMSGFWPTADEDPAAEAYIVEFAHMWREKPKVVFSATLDSVEVNARLVRRDTIAELRRIKAETEADVDISGPTLAGAAIAAGLVDEYRMMVNPVVLGAGTPFLPEGVHIDLELVETRRFDSGVVFLRYRSG
jgi:dihydrofolate reductase